VQAKERVGRKVFERGYLDLAVVEEEVPGERVKLLWWTLVISYSSSLALLSDWKV
jgi:hypothetical protein